MLVQSDCFQNYSCSPRKRTNTSTTLIMSHGVLTDGWDSGGRTGCRGKCCDMCTSNTASIGAGLFPCFSFQLHWSWGHCLHGWYVDFPPPFFSFLGFIPCNSTITTTFYTHPLVMEPSELLKRAHKRAFEPRGDYSKRKCAPVEWHELCH